MLRKLLSPLVRPGCMSATLSSRPLWKSSVAQYGNPAFTEHGELELPSSCIYMLGNGLRIIGEQTGYTLACISLFCLIGSRYEKRSTNGSTHLIEHMAFKGVRKFPRFVFEDHIRRLGAKLMCKTTREFQVFTAVCPQEHVHEMIHILYSIVARPAFSDEQLECARYDVKSELDDTDRNPKKILFDYLHQTAFQGTSLGLPVMGSWCNYQKFDKDHLKEFMQANYTPNRMVLSVSSCYSFHDIVCSAQENFGTMTCCDFTAEWDCRYTGSAAWYRNDDLSHAHVAIAVETCGINGKDYMAMMALKYLLGRWDETQAQGLASWPALAHKSCVSQLCSRYEAFYIPYSDVGLFGVYFVASKSTDLEDMTIALINEWKVLCTSITDKDIERAHARAKLELSRRVTGTVRSCYDMGYQFLYSPKRYSMADQYHRMDRANCFYLMDVANNYFYDRCPVVAAVGPTETLPNYSRIRSEMYWLRL